MQWEENEKKLQDMMNQFEGDKNNTESKDEGHAKIVDSLNDKVHQLELMIGE